MTRELQTEQRALKNVFQRLPIDESVAEENVVDHHRCRQSNEEKGHAEKKIRQLSLTSLPLISFRFRLPLRRGETRDIR